MKIKKIEKINDCIGSEVIFRYYFDININEYHIKKLSELGNLNYYKDFIKPFYIINTFDGTTIKGILYDNMFEVVFLKKGLRKNKFELNQFLKKI